MSPLEKVPFASFYPLQKELRGTCFFSKTTFSSGLIYQRLKKYVAFEVVTE